MGKKLLTTMKSKGLAHNVAVYRSLEMFSDRLRQPVKDKTIAVVLAPTEKDLLDIYFIKYLFCKMPVVLLLPDRQRDTAAIGRRCGSRFMSYIDADFKEIRETLHALGDGVNSLRQDDDFENHQYAA
jgi:hypothetical protein